jgi:hypothetical protein
MEPPSKYDQENYPEGRKHEFHFNMDWVEKVESETPEVEMHLRSCGVSPDEE